MDKALLIASPAKFVEPVPAVTNAPGAQALQFLALLGKEPETTYFRTIRHRSGANRSRRGADLLGFDAAALEADNAAGDSI